MKRVLDGVIIEMTQEELAARDTGEDLITAEDRYQAAYAWQMATCDGNKFALLTSIKTMCAVTSQPVPPKATACLLWLASLWGERDARDAANTQDADFSGFGPCPHTFAELQAEIGQ